MQYCECKLFGYPEYLNSISACINFFLCLFCISCNMKNLETDYIFFTLQFLVVNSIFSLMMHTNGSLYYNTITEATVIIISCLVFYSVIKQKPKNYKKQKLIFFKLLLFFCWSPKANFLKVFTCMTTINIMGIMTSKRVQNNTQYTLQMWNYVYMFLISAWLWILAELMCTKWTFWLHSIWNVMAMFCILCYLIEQRRISLEDQGIMTKLFFFWNCIPCIQCEK